MIHRMLRYPSGWEWHVLQHAGHRPRQHLPSRKDSAKQIVSALTDKSIAELAEHASEQSEAEQHIEQLKKLFPECADWMDTCEGRRTNQIIVEDTGEQGPLVYGTLMFQITEHHDDIQPFHFWLAGKRLITIHDDMRLPLRLQTISQTKKLGECNTAPEALFAMLNVILEPFHEGLDGFETRLGELEATMRSENRTGLIDVIFERRYELLHWSHLFIPVRELHGAAKEAFMNDLMETESFKRITHKLDRIELLLKHYALEIDTLISMDDAIASFRGNDIMKTLTIFTVLFLPATIAGSLWGTNFNKLPWKDYAWGFTAMMTIIIAITTAIYIWLWKKGWTGDLLHGRKPRMISGQEPPSRLSRSQRERSKSGRASAAQHASAMLSSELASPPLSRSRKKRT
ncbi:CorA family divalent cation transporter [Paenibacillus harenae]|uniref:Mg2+ and Co2+ transporter CorA n=1 Tax=Paenibacillus harenae TaxID=306543 RepID=A0ABT9U849_PAEHA|nr:CorA family divalent cation transporter [Paenibacillus harenae]MDQ0063498.1 Mg2+ and Co2+ transporter CorA [Paenibacillus harenae]MDQ0115743.1 Mg2+ and Co2+ transporter CorA [Paenibacillus harenae]